MTLQLSRFSDDCKIEWRTVVEVNVWSVLQFKRVVVTIVAKVLFYSLLSLINILSFEDKDQFSTWTDNPTGRTNDFPGVSLKWLQGKKSLTPDQILAANAEATAFTQSKFVADAEAYVSKLVSLPHQHAPFIAALISSTLKPTFLKAFAAAIRPNLVRPSYPG